MIFARFIPSRNMFALDSQRPALIAAGLALLMLVLAGGPAHAQLFGGGMKDAIEKDDAAEVRTQLISGKPANQRDAEGTPMLVIAAANNRVFIGRLLLQSGARINDKDAKGETPLTMSIRKGNGGFAKMLLDQGADPNTRGANGEPPLIVAVITGNTGVIQSLVDAKADLQGEDYTGSTPLAVAEQRNQKRIAEILRKAGATE